MRTLTNALPDPSYAVLRANTAELTKAWKASLDNGELTKLETFKQPPILPRGDPNTPGYWEASQRYNSELREREKLAKNLISKMAAEKHPEMAKAGVTTTLGYNFYDLRAPVRFLFPVNTHFRNQIARIGRVNDGYGTAAHWKATRNVGTSYAGASEGQRTARGVPDENDYTAIYKELGMERGVSFTAQFAGEGYADNLADEHIRGLYALQLQEEGILIHGNSGSSASAGYKLATCPTPLMTGNTINKIAAGVVTTHTVGTNGNLSSAGGADLPYTSALTTSSYVSVACVLLTAMGNPRTNQYGYGVFPTISNGLTPSYVRNNVDGSKDTINGGMSAVSALSTVLQATSSHLTIACQLPTASLPLKGVFGYAWFVDVESSSTGSLGNALFAGVTTTPYCYISGTPTGTQTAAASGLSTDSSFNSLDFDGLFSYAATTAGAGWTDLYGDTLTTQSNGRVTEFETVLQSIFDQYQCGIQEIWCDSTAAVCLDAAIRYSGASATGYQFVTQRDGQNNLLGGFVVSAYQSRYAIANNQGGLAIPIYIHPMFPSGTVYFHLKDNPYPHSRAPYMWGCLVQRDYYSIEWPQVTREWPFGTYVHEVLAGEMPWIPSVITGIGSFSATASH